MKVFRWEDNITRKGPYNNVDFYESVFILGIGKHNLSNKESCLLYLQAKLDKVLMHRHSNNPSHPTAYRLYRQVLGSDYYNKTKHKQWLSGFSSLEQMKKWFKLFIPSLIKAGYVLVEYDVDDKNVVGDDFQVVFKRSRKRKVIDYV